MSTQAAPRSPEDTPSKKPSRRRHSSRSKSPSRRRRSNYFDRFLYALTAPWRKLRALWKYWAPSKSVKRQLSGAAFVLKKASQFDGTNYKMLREDGKLLVRTWPSRATMLNPLWWLTSAFSFGMRWIVSRPYLPMLLALPGVVTSLVLVGAISAGNSITTGTHGIVYKRLLTESVRTKDIPTARLAIDALLQLEPSNDTLLYDSALIEADAGNVESARQIMMELATSAGSGPAALWLARETASTYANSAGGLNIAQWTPEQCREYYRWLTIAVNNAPEDPLPRRMTGELFRLRGDSPHAYEALLPIADVDTDTSYDVCLLEHKLGHQGLAMARGEKLIRVYKSLLADKPDDFVSRARYAMLLAVTEREDEGKKLLEEGLQLETNPENVLQLRRTLADVLVMASERMSQTKTTPRGLLERYRKLVDAVAVDPTNPTLIDAITRACVDAAESKNNELFILREALVQNVDPDTAHFILGTVALNRGEIGEATQHLEIAAKKNPNLPGLLNNLAYAISHGPTPDLPRALRLSDAAIASIPDHPYLHETRGQIYLKLKNYTAAIADLEVALNAPELRPQVRESLAQAYEASGQAEIAQRHRELLKAGK